MEGYGCDEVHHGRADRSVSCDTVNDLGGIHSHDSPKRERSRAGRRWPEWDVSYGGVRPLYAQTARGGTVCAAFVRTCDRSPVDAVGAMGVDTPGSVTRWPRITAPAPASLGAGHSHDARWYLDAHHPTPPAG